MNEGGGVKEERKLYDFLSSFVKIDILSYYYRTGTILSQTMQERMKRVKSILSRKVRDRNDSHPAKSVTGMDS